MAMRVVGAPIFALRKFQPVSVPSGTTTIGNLMPATSLPSTSTFGSRNGIAAYGAGTSAR